MNIRALILTIAQRQSVASGLWIIMANGIDPRYHSNNSVVYKQINLGSDHAAMERIYEIHIANCSQHISV
jgi:hypothetical protein